jgi:hypothetical protein
MMDAFLRFTEEEDVGTEEEEEEKEEREYVGGVDIEEEERGEEEEEAIGLRIINDFPNLLVLLTHLNDAGLRTLSSGHVLTANGTFTGGGFTLCTFAIGNSFC